MIDTSDLTALGRRVTEFEVFETFDAPEGLERVILSSDEFTAICPVTAQRDYYTVIANYVPARVHGRCLESKTWKLYLAQFANTGELCEALAARMCRDLFDALAAEEVRVVLIQRPRGGITIKASAHLSTDAFRRTRHGSFYDRN